MSSKLIELLMKWILTVQIVRGSAASHAADFIFPQSVSNIKFLYDEPKRINDGLNSILAVFGLSNNPCSLLRQLGYSNFSYCFAPNNSESSAILLGSDFKLRKRSKNFEQQPAQLVHNNNFPDAYSVNLAGISVGQTEIPVTTSPFQENGPITMILDSVTPVTLLKRETYESVKKEFLSQMNQFNQMNIVANVTSSSLGLDLCFSNPTFWPQLALKFSPAATMTLSSENYVVKDMNTGLECLAIVPSQDVSVMGTMMQSNHLMVFDVDRSTLSFEQVNCGRLSVSSATHASVPRGVQMIHHLSLVAALFVVMILRD
jgi:Xylanase inhibitor C-terminal